MRSKRQIKQHGHWYFWGALIADAIEQGAGHLMVTAAAFVASLALCTALYLAALALQAIKHLF